MAATRVNVERLKRELVTRGWNGIDLAFHAGLSPATVSAALQGRPVSTTTVHKMVLALTRQPKIEGSEELVG